MNLAAWMNVDWDDKSHMWKLGKLEVSLTTRNETFLLSSINVYVALSLFVGLRPILKPHHGADNLLAIVWFCSIAYLYFSTLPSQIRVKHMMWVTASLTRVEIIFYSLVIRRLLLSPGAALAAQAAHLLPAPCINLEAKARLMEQNTGPKNSPHLL